MNHKVLRRALDLCWATLCVYFILKAFGATWFEAIPGTDFFDTHLWATAILGTLTSYVLFTIYYMAICAKKHLDLWVHIALLPYFCGNDVFESLSCAGTVAYGARYAVKFCDTVLACIQILRKANSGK